MQDKNTTTIIMIGDVSGNPGMGALFLGLSALKKEYNADFIIVNGENAQNGFGITIDDYQKMKEYGADVVTSGNHIWQQSEIYEELDKTDTLLRPANFPISNPGKGICTITKNGKTLTVINAQGRVNMIPLDCPFVTVDNLVKEAVKKSPLIVLDFHAEDTTEKEAMGFFLDGRVTAVVGTHTHVQTMDAKILPNKTAYITDLGLTGSISGVIGGKASVSIERQFTQVPIKSEVNDDKGVINGVVIVADTQSGKAISIETITR